MKRFALGMFFFLLLGGTAFAGRGLDGFLNNLNIEARADMHGFAGRISAQFGIPEVQVHAVIGAVSAPADAFMVFQLGEMAHLHPDAVLNAYDAHRGKGWGVIAKNLGIKPGSPQFHALKRGDFVLHGSPGKTPKGKVKDKGKGKKR